MADDIGARIHAAIVGAIEQYGWMAQASYNESFEFVYSIGLHPRYGFELVVTGLPPEISYPILKIIARDLEKIETFEQNVELVPSGFVRFYKCVRTPGDAASEVVIQADNYYGMQVPLVQVVVGTVDGQFFDTPGVDEDVQNAQPLLFATPQSTQVH